MEVSDLEGMLLEAGKSETRKQEEAGHVPEAAGHRQEWAVQWKRAVGAAQKPKWERNTM